MRLLQLVDTQTELGSPQATQQVVADMQVLYIQRTGNQQWLVDTEVGLGLHRDKEHLLLDSQELQQGNLEPVDNQPMDILEPD